MSQEQGQECKVSNFPVVIVVVSYCLALASNLLNPIWNAAFFERLAIGRWIYSERSLPTMNLWVRDGFGEGWSNGSWLFDLLIGAIHFNFEDQGLIIAKFFSLALSLILLSLIFAKLAKNTTVGAFLASIVFAGSFHLGAFEQSLFGLPLLALIFLFVERLRIRRKSFALIVAIVASGSLLGAIDPRSTALLPVFALYFFIREFELKHLVLPAAVVFLAVILSPLVSPYKGSQYLEVLNMTYQQLQLSLSTQSSAATIFDYGWSALLLLLGCFLASVSRARPLVTDIFFVIFFVLLGAADKSFIQLALFFVGITYARYWGVHLQGLLFIPGLVEALRRFEGRLARLKSIAPGTSFLLLAIAFVKVYGMRFTPLAEIYYPDELVIQAIKRTNAPALLSDLEVGSFLVYKRAIEMDPLDQATLPIASLQFPLRDGGVIISEQSWQSLISREDVRSVICRSGSPLATRLELDNKWSEVELDLDSVSHWKLFIRS